MKQDGRCGYRRIAAILGRKGVVACPDTVRSIMRDLGLVAVQPH
ncbi:IS3 family transposase [Actinomyces israelii]